MKTLTQKLAASAALAVFGVLLNVVPAHAEIVQQNFYRDVSAGGCTARFFYRGVISDGGIAGAPYGWWMKVADSCGMYSFNDAADFAAMGLCNFPAGILEHGNTGCSNGGYLVQKVYMHANCGREVLERSIPFGGCRGYPLDGTGW